MKLVDARVIAALATVLSMTSTARAQPPSDASSTETVPPEAYRLTDTLLWIDTGFAAAHMTEGFLARRTFSSDVGATLTQATYVTIPASPLLKLGPIYNIVATTSILVSHAFAHYDPSSSNAIPVFYERWTNDSNTAGYNRFGVNAPAIGRIAQGILFAFDASLLATLVSSVRDGFLYGFTLTQKPHAVEATTTTGTHIAPLMVPAGAGLGVSRLF
jgi:hypothetical protein